MNARMPKRGKNCQSSHRHSPSGEENQSGGLEAGPANTRSYEKKKKNPLLSTHPPTYPSIHPCLWRTSLCPVTYFKVNEAFKKMSSMKEKTELQMQVTVEVWHNRP